MKLQSFAVATALVIAAIASPATVSAAECTEAQLESLNNVDSAAVETACPSLFADGASALSPTNADAFTPEALQAISPCKESVCLTQLQKFVEVVPDCTVAGINAKGTYSASVKLCEAFSTGDVTVAKAAEIFGDVAKNVSNAFASIFGGEGSVATDGTELPTVSTDTPVSDATSSSTKGDGGVPSPQSSTVTPVPSSTKSGSSATAVTGVLVIAAATVASTLLF